MPRVQATLAVVSLTLLSACHLLGPIGESVVHVRGNIDTAPEVATCNLELFREKAKSASRKAVVKLDFLESFTIAPGFHRYYFVITCPGVQGRYRSSIVELGGTRYINPPLDLGRITITDVSSQD